MMESADLLYHLLVVLRARGVPLQDVLAELARRTAQSGLAGKGVAPDGLSVGRGPRAGASGMDARVALGPRRRPLALPRLHAATSGRRCAPTRR